MEKKGFVLNLLFLLGLIKKMVQYSSSELLLVSLCGGAQQTADAHVGTLLVEVVASVLDNEVIIDRIKCDSEAVVECPMSLLLVGGSDGWMDDVTNLIGF